MPPLFGGDKHLARNLDGLSAQKGGSTAGALAKTGNASRS
jgi:hypothetical protein